MKKETTSKAGWLPRFFTLEMFVFTITALSGLVLLGSLITLEANMGTLFFAGAIFTLSLAVLIRLVIDPDSIRARQSGAMLTLANQMLSYMNDGMNREAALKVCNLLLPSTAAIAVAITNKERILGYAGYEERENPSGSAIKTSATYDVLEGGEALILRSPEDIGIPAENSTIQAAIIVPLFVGRKVEGTLKFYYRKPRHINETQKTIAEGFGQLLSTQMAAAALEEQTMLATSMELKMLQSQINPHFLFNTINTIASFIRTDPESARRLLREFAMFYRRTLEDSADLITFTREMEQTRRYFTFEVARFGADRLCLVEEIDPQINKMLIPPFLMQPLVENAVRHAMSPEGKLTIRIIGEVEGDDVIIYVKDDGVGMSEEKRQNILNAKSKEGLGIAAKNVHDRICGYFDQGTSMDVESELGVGTSIKLTLINGMHDSQLSLMQ